MATLTGSARAIVTLPPPADAAAATAGARLRVTDVDGKIFASPLTRA
jgi:hypothetical protein